QYRSDRSDFGTSMDLVFTVIGSLTLVVLVIGMVFFGRYSLGWISLPCIMGLTSIVYFYVMPAVTLEAGQNGFLGLYISSLEWLHVAVLLYALGAFFAMLLQSRILALNPALPRKQERHVNWYIYTFLLILAVAALGVLVATGKLRFSVLEA